MEIILEPLLQLIVELLGSVVSAAVGLALGTIALALIVGARRVIAHSSRSRFLEGPAGDTWQVGVVYGLKNPIGSRLTGMTGDARRRRRRRGIADTAVEDGEHWHPRKVLDAYGDAAGCVAPFVLVAAVVVVIVVAIELLVVVPIALIFLVYSALRGRWQVELTTPDQRTLIFDASSFSEAREVSAAVAARIRAGDPPT